MVSRKDICFLSSLIFFTLVFGVFLGAEETGIIYDEGNFFIEWRGPRFIQRIRWNPVEWALRYELSLEEEQAGKYEKLLQESTRENFLNVSLRPGRYRYQVGVYNLLDRLEYTSDWIFFEVLNALQPKIITFSPEEFFLDTEEEWQITVTGEDIDAGADIRLQSKDGEGIRPRRIEVKGNTVLLVFDKGQLAPGSYQVHIRNPGGLEDSGTFTVSLHKPEEIPPGRQESSAAPSEPSGRPDFIISAAYAPLIPLYGILFVPNAFEEIYFLQGAALRFGVLPLKRGGEGPLAKGFGHYFGGELGVSWYRAEEAKERYTVGAQVLDFQIRALYQLWLPGRTSAFNFRAGMGVTTVLDLYYEYGDSTRHFTGEYISLGGGISFQLRIVSHLFFEIGMDFTHIFSPDDPSPPGYIRPSLGLLWQF
ncbi:hypothetical protein FACS189485_13940 [Spirochaetia bacterium]|nr:hypothetical protein FACS189485_13940 [Spirochaetia bacterium]